jgi:ATP-dependent RNA helicase SUPV3L1/SUV3
VGASGEETRTLLAAANRVLRGEVAARARRLAAAPDSEFGFSPEGGIAWRGGAVGRLLPGEGPLAPRVDVLPGDFLEGDLRDMVRRRLAAYLRDAVARGLGPLFAAREAELSGAARGLVFQLGEALGSLPAAAVAPQRAALDPGDRKALARLGVRLGTESIYVDGLLKPKTAALRGLLWAVHGGAPVPAAPGGIAAPRDPSLSDEAYAAMGYRVLGRRVLRVDRVERLAAAARKLARQGPFGAAAELAALAGCAVEDLASVLPALGYRAVLDENGVMFHARRRGPAKPEREGEASGPPRRRKRRRPAPEAADGPFAKLRELRLAR